MVSEDAKATRPDSDGWHKLLCKCGSVRVEAKYIKPGGSDQTDTDDCYEQSPVWLLVSCKQCRAVLYYNGC